MSDSNYGALHIFMIIVLCYAIIVEKLIYSSQEIQIVWVLSNYRLLCARVIIGCWTCYTHLLNWSNYLGYIIRPWFYNHCYNPCHNHLTCVSNFCSFYACRSLKEYIYISFKLLCLLPLVQLICTNVIKMKVMNLQLTDR